MSKIDFTGRVAIVTGRRRFGKKSCHELAKRDAR